MTAEIKMVVGDSEFTKWQRYEIESDLLKPADAFSLTAPNNDAEMAGVVAPGDVVKILVDGEPQMIGHVDDVNYSCTPEQGAQVEVVGRDLFLFLVDCSAPLLSLRKKTLLQLAEQLAEEWIFDWSGPVTSQQISRIKIEPGETVLDVLLRFAAKEKLLIWIDPDGEGQIGRPNYTQSISYRLCLYAGSNPDRRHNNIRQQSVSESWRGRYSTVTVYGTTGNTAANYGKSSRKKAIALDADIDPERPLIITDGDVKTLQQAQDRANEEVARRKFEGTTLTYTASGHYGTLPDGTRNLFQADTLADVHDELSDHHGTYYMTRRQFRLDEDGPTTELELHPKGLWLA